jgi:hypothetical protein
MFKYKSLLAFLFITNLLVAQDEKSTSDNFNQSLGIQFNVGFNSFNLSSAEEYFEKTLLYFQELNVPVEAQTLYPANFLLGGGVYYFPSRSFSLSLVAEFTKTKAYSLYGDYAGTIDINSDISFFSISFGGQKHFIDVFIFQPYLGVDLSAVIGEYNYVSKIVYYELPDYSHNNEVSYSNFGFGSEGYFGLLYNFYYASIYLQCGYKYCYVPKPSNEEINWEFRSEDFPFDLKSSGIVIKFLLKTGIYW